MANVDYFRALDNDFIGETIMVCRLAAREDSMRFGSLIAKVGVEDTGVGYATRW